MKTINLTLACMILVLFAKTIQAENYRTFRMPVSGDKILEILVKSENLVEEFIPGHEDYIKEKNNFMVNPLDLPLYVEEEVNENLPVAIHNDNSGNREQDVAFNQLLCTLIQTEPEVQDLNFDNREVFESIQKESQFRLTAEKLAQCSRPEAEVSESYWYLIATSLTKK